MQLNHRDCVDIVFRLPDWSERSITFLYRPLGLYMYMEKPLRVKAVTPGSQAEGLGIRPGWTIVKINDDNMHDRNAREMHMLLISVAGTLRNTET